MTGILSYQAGFPLLGPVPGYDNLDWSSMDCAGPLFDCVGAPLLSGYGLPCSNAHTSFLARKAADYDKPELLVDVILPRTTLDHGRAYYSHALPVIHDQLPALAIHAACSPQSLGSGQTEINDERMFIAGVPLNSDYFPEPAKSEFDQFVQRVCVLLEKLLVPEDGPEPIRFVITHKKEPNAFFSISKNGSEKILGITLGMLELIQNDEEIAFILGHELEHGLSQLQQQVSEYQAQGNDLMSFLLQRSVENEVDAKSVMRRLIRAGFNPHASVAVLKRLSQRTEFDGAGETHTSLTSRIDTIEAILAGDARLFGGHTEFRLDDGLRSSQVFGNIKAYLFFDKLLFDHQISQILNFLNVRGVATQYYEAIKTGEGKRYFIRIPSISGKIYDYSTETFYVSFSYILSTIIKKIELCLPEGYDPEWFVGVKQLLARDLYEEFERSRAEALGENFVFETEDQFKAFCALEERSFQALDMSDIVFLLKKKDALQSGLVRLQDKLKQRSEIRAQALIQAKIDKIQNEMLPRCLKEIELSKLFFQSGPGLDAFIKTGYLEYEKKQLTLDSEVLVPTLRKAGLRLHLIHDFVTANFDRNQRLIEEHKSNILFFNNTIDGMITLLQKTDCRDLSYHQRVLLLNKILFLLKGKSAGLTLKEHAFSVSETYLKLLKLMDAILFKLSRPYGFEDMQDKVKGFVAESMLILVKVYENGTPNVQRTTQKSLIYLLNKSAPYLSHGDLECCLNTVQKIVFNNYVMGLRSANDFQMMEFFYFVGDVRRIFKELETKYGVADVTDKKFLVDTLKTIFIERFCDRFGVTPAQILTLIYISAPYLMPDQVSIDELATIKTNFIAVTHNEDFMQCLGVQFDFNSLVCLFYDAYDENRNDERSLEISIDASFGDRKKALIKEYEMIVKAKIQSAYEFFYSIPFSLWRAEHIKKPSARHSLYEVNYLTFYEQFRLSEHKAQLLSQYGLRKIKKENPWDVKSALFFSQFTSIRHVMGSFVEAWMHAYWKWCLQHTGQVAEASYLFWKSVNDVINVGDLQKGFRKFSRVMNGLFTQRWRDPFSQNKSIFQAIIAEYQKAVHGQDYVVDDLVFVEQYLAGLLRFVHEYVDALPEYQTGEVSKEKRQRIKGEIKARFDLEPLQILISSPRLMTQYTPEVIARTLLFSLDYTEIKGTNQNIHELITFLWQFKDFNPVVYAFFLRPEVVGLSIYQSFKNEMAIWQIRQLPGFDVEKQRLKDHPSEFPEPKTIRPVVRAVYDLMKQQFPDPGTSNYSVFEFIESSLLPGEQESFLLSELRLNKTNWVRAQGLVCLDAPDLLSKYITSPQERVDAIFYLIGITDKPFQFGHSDENDLSQHFIAEKDVRAFKSFYLQNGSVFQIRTLEAILDKELETLQGSLVYDAVKKIIMDEAYHDPALSEIFDEYMEVLPAGERKILIALALANFDPSTGHSSFVRLLESSGPLGAKGAQGLITSGWVTGKLRDKLMSSLDFALPPFGDQIFKQLQFVFGDNYKNIVGVGRLAGSGSLNYAVEVYVRLASGEIRRVCVRIQKEYVQGQIENEYLVWQEVIKRLKSPNKSPQVRRYAMLIENLMTQAYDTLKPGGVELDLEQERQKAALALKAYETTTPHVQTGLQVTAVQPDLEIQQMIQPEYQKRASVYAFVDHTKLNEIKPEILRNAIALQIIDAEIEALSEGRLVFDPDGHQGNWLVDLEGGRLVRVDTAQITTVTKEEVGVFKAVFKALMSHEKNAQNILKAFFDKRFYDVFQTTQKPEGFRSALDYVFSLDNMPSFKQPMDKLLFIQNQLESFYANQGVVIELPLKKSISDLMGSFLRINMYRQYVGDLAYYKKLTEFLGMDYRKIILAYAAQSMGFGA